MATPARIVSVNDRGHVVGQDHHRARLRDDDVDLIVALRDEGLSYSGIAAKFECSKATVADYVKGRRRGHTAVGQKRIVPDPNRRRFKPAKPSEFDLIL